ncbi:LPXTG cell wall anchor domain-containing protein [Dactylosporangium sp. NBC_01737]|uniref:LPXTG cell wall anchor domain-containing protein n=1 Tax=Dactylosporangium sp. NBC_01737 TaxID=2975959 RepID=UPI002E0FBFC9|nr:LPXTG cell wall anchor domain-containing protein [Dactylosporangium sp. NBC_01737]
MGNMLFRRVVVGAAAATAAVGLSTVFASPASAHATGATGSAVCVSVDGKYEITWKLTNDYNSVVTLGDIKLELDKEAKSTLSKSTLPSTIAARPAGSPLTEVTFTSVVEKPATKVKLTYKAKWADNYRSPGSSEWVALTGPCPSPSPSASPSPSGSKSVPASPSTSATPGLPVTGTSSTMPLVGTGAALVVGGVALVATLRRRRRVTFTAE